MPELRKDPVVGRWVIVATERAKRPDQYGREAKLPAQEEPCPFCAGQEAKTPPEIYALRKPGAQANQPGWDVRVVPSIMPVLRIEGELNRRGRGIYDLMDGIGAHEVVVETPEHQSSLADLSDEQVAKVLSVHVDRITDLSKDPRFKYVLMFKNHGVIAGAGIVRHCRSQLIALPVNPLRVKEELQGASAYYQYRERCIFCDIIAQELQVQKRIVVDHPHFIVIAPFASRFPFEMMLLPKRHGADFTAIDRARLPDLARALRQAIGKLTKGLSDPPFNLTLHEAPFRRPAKAGYWKTIEEDFHWHMEIMPRLTRVAGFEWGTGFYINPTPPEEAANFLRNVAVT